MVVEKADGTKANFFGSESVHLAAMRSETDGMKFSRFELMGHFIGKKWDGPFPAGQAKL